MQWRAGTGACWAGFAADGIASNGNSANIWTAGCVSLIRKWLNLEKEAETQGQILSPLPSFPLLASLASPTLQRSKEIDVSKSRLSLSRDSCSASRHPKQGCGGGCWAGMPHHLEFSDTLQIAQF